MQKDDRFSVVTPVQMLSCRIHIGLEPDRFIPMIGLRPERNPLVRGKWNFRKPRRGILSLRGKLPDLLKSSWWAILVEGFQVEKSIRIIALQRQGVGKQCAGDIGVSQGMVHYAEIVIPLWIQRLRLHQSSEAICCLLQVAIFK